MYINIYLSLKAVFNFFEKLYYCNFLRVLVFSFYGAVGEPSIFKDRGGLCTI